MISSIINGLYWEVTRLEEQEFLPQNTEEHYSTKEFTGDEDQNNWKGKEYLGGVIHLKYLIVTFTYTGIKHLNIFFQHQFLKPTTLAEIISRLLLLVLIKRTTLGPFSSSSCPAMLSCTLYGHTQARICYSIPFLKYCLPNPTVLYILILLH